VGQSAVGWRVGVYWPADQAFYCGGIQGFDAAAGRHEVAYDDGEQGPVNLGVDRVKWILPPGAAGGWVGGIDCPQSGMVAAQAQDPSVRCLTATFVSLLPFAC
jgi:hypothetical protein